MELKRASTGLMSPERKNGAAPTNTAPNHPATTMKKMLCLETKLRGGLRVRKKRVAPRARATVPGSQKTQASSGAVSSE
jgi:hypothetical protein